ncbi:hypothetical protein COLO4_19233 [Corchorus olitorius]|uniref:GCK domain-containing protein n=1 Tax=Corchorus olitorius TaxID=93759 RepID=A0A1R3J672_9ROSI|nr:hypothetical protein COLO4_19233 [Corchorus olitorius]
MVLRVVSSTVVRDAAAITGGYLGHSLIRSVSNNFAGELWFKRAKVCKMVVLQFELCGIFHRYSEGKDAELCQNHLKDLNEFCGEFKPSWNDWWTHDLKRNFCQFKSDALKRCMEKGPAEAIPVYKELLEDVCGRKF